MMIPIEIEKILKHKIRYLENLAWTTAYHCQHEAQNQSFK